MDKKTFKAYQRQLKQVLKKDATHRNSKNYSFKRAEYLSACITRLVRKLEQNLDYAVTQYQLVNDLEPDSAQAEWIRERLRVADISELTTIQYKSKQDYLAEIPALFDYDAG